MKRLHRGYAGQFEVLLRQMRVRRLDQGIGWLFARAGNRADQAGARVPAPLPRPLASAAGEPRLEALAEVSLELADKCRAWQRRRMGTESPPPPLFWCDAGLGGLARWLRAAGHPAAWQPRIADDELLRYAAEQQAAVVTTDSLLMERRLVRDSIIPTLWLPPALPVFRQLRVVLRYFHLSLGEPRCMQCGGPLAAADKEALRERIPPRTYRWLDAYQLCGQCGQLFWRGTHWRHIMAQLEALRPVAASCAADVRGL